MKMTLAQAFEAIGRGETPEQYEKRMKRIRRLANERDDLYASLTVLTDPGDEAKAAKKQERLTKVLQMIEELK